MNHQFSWPNHYRAAVSFSFDDTRPTQIDRAVPILDTHNLRGTFYATFGSLEKRLEDWRAAAERGHELGNHSVHHPCSGNFPFARGKCLENYTLEQMDAELAEAERALDEMIGAKPRSFAYPCGQKFVGRGEQLQSYVPVVAKQFIAGRGFRDEWTNDPTFCDLAQILGRDMDCVPLETLQLWMDEAISRNDWLVLAGHDVGEAARQTVEAETFDAICRYAVEKGVWVDTVATIAAYVQENREPV